MRYSLLLCAATLALSSCGVGRRFQSTPEEKLAQLVARHPELARPDTVVVRDTVTIPQVQVQTRFVYRVNEVKERADSLRLDSLLQKLEVSLDTAKRRATTRQVFHYLRVERPRFPDTLCFDTLGLRGKVWRAGSAYRISLVRQQIRQPHQARAVVATLHPCDCDAPVVWYQLASWPRWWLFLLGLLLGLGISIRLVRR